MTLAVIVLGQLLGAILGVFVLLPQRRVELQTPQKHTEIVNSHTVDELLHQWPDSDEHSAVTFSNVTKEFGDTRALDSVSIIVPGLGAIGLLGPNGAGKTTLIKILLGLTRPDSGSVQIAGGFPHSDARRRIGYCPDVPSFDSWMTSHDVLNMEARLIGLDESDARRRASVLLAIIGLSNAQGRVGGWSRGMRQRLSLARALVGFPTLLVLDEPTSALDPAGRANVLDLLSALASKIAIIFSTHRIEDVERVCDRVIMLGQGRVIASPTKGQFVDVATTSPDIVIHTPNKEQRDTLELFCSEHALNFLEQHSPKSLENLFLELTGAR